MRFEYARAPYTREGVATCIQDCVCVCVGGFYSALELQREISPSSAGWSLTHGKSHNEYTEYY